jgi:hypothetical protein
MASISQAPLPPDVAGQMGAKPDFAGVGGMMASQAKPSSPDSGDTSSSDPLGNVETSIDAVKRILTNVAQQVDTAAPYVKRMIAIADQMMAQIRSDGAPGTQAQPEIAAPPTNPSLEGSAGGGFPG